MKRYNPNKPLISIHVPKCAGTSFTRVLRAWFKEGLYLHYYEPETQQMPPRRTLQTTSTWRRFLLGHKYQPRMCIHGHFNRARGFGICDYYPEVEQFVTVLRDPFEIAVSDYFYNKARGATTQVNGQAVPFGQAFDGLADYFEREMLHRHSYVVNHMPVELTANNFASELERLFIYVGIAEDMDTTVRQMARKLGFPETKVEHWNASPRDEAALPGMREAFEREHPLEYAMYQFALERYKD